MTSFLNTKNIVIMGFNPQEHNFKTLLNDISIEGKIAGYNNYYIGPDLSNQDSINLGGYGISCISYTPSDFTHPEIVSILQEFCDYIPRDMEFPSVYTGKKYVEADIPAFELCVSMGNNKLREILNGNIANIIPPNSVPTKEQIQKLQLFYQKFSAQMHIAWFVNPQSEYGNNLYGYKIKAAVGRGAFGNVFEAYDERGNKFALKILLPEVKDKVEYLSCFRRGIRSMNILKEKNIGGMVKIYSSYEVPACIVMDYVEGITLRDAIDNCKLKSPNKKIEVIIKIASIINNAHNLEECILHRDLKPENIMLQDFYYDNTEDPISIVILDFDLSWHKGATELTVALGAMSQGFMAPEQVEENEKYKRNTAVDMYSIGMLAYYILVGENPAPNQHRFRDFKEQLMKQIHDKYRVAWKCLPSFLAETIEKATMNDPEKRISLDAFIYNMNAALNMLISNEIVNSNPMLLRELAAQIDNPNQIQIEDFGRKLFWTQDVIGKSIVLELTQLGKDVIINVKLTKMRMGQDLREPKYLERAKEKSLAAVNNTIFCRKKGEILMSEIDIEVIAKLPKNLSLKYISEVAKNIQEIRMEMELK